MILQKRLLRGSAKRGYFLDNSRARTNIPRKPSHNSKCNARPLQHYLAAVHAIELHPLSPSFGLEVRGITRRTCADKKAHKTLRDAFAASRGLLLLRGLRGLSCDELIALSNVFGDVEAAPADGSYEVARGRRRPRPRVCHGALVGRVPRRGRRHDVAVRRRDGQAPSWHTDQSFRSPRPLASAMYCLETPGDGVGQTVFCSTVAACEDLPARVRTRLEKLRAAHSYEQLSASFQRFAGGTAKTLSRSHEPALYHLVEDGALYLAPHAISHVVDETGKEIAASELVDAPLGARARSTSTRGARGRSTSTRGSNFTLCDGAITLSGII